MASARLRPTRPQLLRMVLTASLLAFAACAPSTGSRNETSFATPDRPSTAEQLADAPEWVTRGCRRHFQQAPAERPVLCGVGTAGPSRNRLAARETAVARARSAIARSIEVTIEDLVQLEDSSTRPDGELRTIAHQLSTASLPACQVESTWQAPGGQIHALVSLEVEKVKQSVRRSRALSARAREDLAERAADAFAELNSRIEAEYDNPSQP